MERIDKIFAIYKNCEAQNNNWGVHYWGSILNTLLRQIDRKIPHSK
jgi:hypothetical protein